MGVVLPRAACLWNLVFEPGWQVWKGPQRVFGWYSPFTCIGVFYQPPSSIHQSFVNSCNYLENLNIHIHFSNFVFLLDLTATTIHFYTHCCLIWYKLSLTQVVTEATHVNTNGTATLIDLALVSNHSLLQNCEVIPPIGNSDHNGILLQLKWKSNKQQVQPQPRPLWRYAHADFNKACDLIDNTNWDALIDINMSLQNWEQQFMKETIPKRTVPKRQNLPWLSKNALWAMRKRNYLYRQAKRTGLPEHEVFKKQYYYNAPQC